MALSKECIYYALLNANGAVMYQVATSVPQLENVLTIGRVKNSKSLHDEESQGLPFRSARSSFQNFYFRSI